MLESKFYNKLKISKEELDEFFSDGKFDMEGWLLQEMRNELDKEMEEKKEETLSDGELKLPEDTQIWCRTIGCNTVKTYRLQGDRYVCPTCGDWIGWKELFYEFFN